MIIVGVDIVEIERVARVLERWGDRFLQRVYTSQEVVYCQGRFDRLAARFAAKEAVMKALGTGLRGVGWRDIEVVRYRGQPPFVQLHGRAQQRANAIGVEELTLSLSHSRLYAIAFVVGDRT